MGRTVEIVSFTVATSKAGSLVAGRPAAIEALRAAAPGLVSATLAELGGGQWLDIMVWETAEQAHAAEALASVTPAFANWGDEHVAAIGPRYQGVIRSGSDV